MFQCQYGVTYYLANYIVQIDILFLNIYDNSLYSSLVFLWLYDILIRWNPVPFPGRKHVLS